MFDRIVIQDCQKNLACRLLHMKNVTKPLRNDVENEKKSITETGGTITETTDDVQSKQFSSRMNSLRHKIASKIFEFFI